MNKDNFKLKNIKTFNLKKKNTKKYLILLILFVLLVIEIITWGLSKAENTIQIELNIVDNSGSLQPQTASIFAVNGGESGYYITLPRSLNTKIITKYYIEQKSINEQGEEVIEYLDKNYGDTIYLTNEQKDNLSLNLKVAYDTKIVATKTLYNKVLEHKIDGNNINLEGYMPEAATLKINQISNIVTDEIINNYQGTLKFAYDIKIIDNGTTYLCANYNETLKISYNKINNQLTYQLLALQDSNNHQSNIDDISSSYSINDTNLIFNVSILKSYLLIDKTLPETPDIDKLPNTGAINMINVIQSKSKWDGEVSKKFDVGNGTVSNPYLITGGSDLAYLANQVNLGQSYEGKYFQLTNDIDLDFKEWTPIGNYDNSFRGIFDGAGHSISNCNISTDSSFPSNNTVYSYGVFGSIGGSNNFRAKIINTQFNNIEITFKSSGNLSGSYQRGYNIGFVTGTMFKNSTVFNVIVKDSKASSDNNISVRNAGIRVLVGGIAGETLSESNVSTNPDDPGYSYWYSIENCYVKANIDLSRITTSSRSYASQYNVGGIIGRIRNQGVWPSNCLFDGSINASGIIGPIFGTVVTSSSMGTGQFNNMWNGNNYSNLTTNSYYTNYEVNNKSFTSSVTSGTAGTNTSYRISTSSSNIGYVQGVNKGIYTNNFNLLTNNFNQNSNSDILWKFENNEFSLVPRISSAIDEANDFNFKVYTVDPYNTKNYSYKWYINEVLDNNIRSTTANIYNTSSTLDKNVLILISDGKYYTVLKFTLPKISINIEFDVDKVTNTLVAKFTGSGSRYINDKDYTFEWYKEDITGIESSKIENETTKKLMNISPEYDYKIIATNNLNEQLSAQGYFEYYNKNVVYVSYNSGNDSNDGMSDSTPVRTMKKAYEKLDSNGNIYSNIIVLMGDYTNTDYLYTTSSNYSTVQSNYSKSATVTGLYKSNNYNAGWYLGLSDVNGTGHLIFADTKFMYMKLYGSTSTNGAGASYIYSQGKNLTMGEGLIMQRYAVSSTGYALANGNAPDFHIVCGFLNYNDNRIADENNNGTVTINSGTYSRILSGSRNGKINSTSHNITGSASNPYNLKLVVDIKNSTTNTNVYPNDINSIFGGQTDGNIYTNFELQVKSGNIGRVIGGSIGYDRTISGYPCNSFFGSTKLLVSGGTINELYGGSLGRNRSDVYYYGNIEININGGTIASNIYGAGAGGVTGYDSNSTDPYKSYGQNIQSKVTINVSGGTVNGNIYGAGYGYSPYLSSSNIATDGGALYGDSYINLTGGIITGSIYGAGKGYSGYSGKNSLAIMKGNTNINISKLAVVNGNIYGAGEGINNYQEMAKLTGDSNLNIGSNFNGVVYGGGNIANCVGNTNIDITGGNLTGEVYGGANLGNTTGISNVNLNSGNVNLIYAGGKSAGVDKSNVLLNGANVGTIYGGSNINGNLNSSNIILESGVANTVYGGNNLGGKTSIVNILLNGASITDTIYGGGNQTNCDLSTLDLKKSSNEVPNIYGGGNQAGVANTIINCDGSNVKNIFGGSNILGMVSSSIVNLFNGTVENLYGGNNKGGNTVNTNINIIGGSATNVYGGGEKATSDISNIKVANGNITNIYGGGNQAGITTSTLEIAGGKITNVYGGSNVSGNVNQTNLITKSSIKINTQSAVLDNGLNMEVSFIANNTTWQSTTYPTIATITVNVTNSTSRVIDNWKGTVVAKDSILYTNYTSTNILEDTGKFLFDQVNKYHGINSIPANGNYSFSFDVLSMQPATDFKLETIVNDNIVFENKELSIQNIYGGNNQGGTTTSSKLNLDYGNIKDIYGGGNQAITLNAELNIKTNVTGCVYGGGNQADVTTTKVNIENSEITDNVYGGGNEGRVIGNTYVNIKNSNLKNSLYAGGNGAYATVYGNTNVVLEGKSTKIANNVFGGGNQAETGNELLKNSLSSVNIVGATVGKNVYGGANTSVVYGKTQTNIGYNAVNDSSLEGGNIKISGNIFGGGEANEAGSEIYDFSYISVTNGTNININASEHEEYYIRGSIFGSGNASSTSGTSFVNIKNYGNIDLPQRNISIQRANEVVLDNSSIVLSGAKDRTNEYSNVNFSISRVNNFKLKNNSTLYLNCGSNLLENLYSLKGTDGVEDIATVQIDSETGNTIKNIDNRIYMYEGKALNIATNEQVTAYGKVSGMIFLGMYTNIANPSTSTGLYNHNFENGEEITNLGTFSSNSYVLAQHKENHNTNIDGFYTNINNNGYAKTKYVEITPENDVYYIWSVGEALEVTNFDLTLTASKYATLGTYELSLTGFSIPNTKFSIIGFSSGLNDGIKLVDRSQIDAIDTTNDLADNNFGLSMKSGKNGWKTNSETNFYTENGGTYNGSSQYIGDNSSYTPTLAFCFYHSQNLTLEQNLGNVKIRLQVLKPIDDLTYEISYIDININLLTALYQDDYYEAAITPGKEYNLFSTSETSITNKSVFSTYFSLFIPNFSENKHFVDYANNERVLVSRNSNNQNLVYKENTKITMIDLVTKNTYYYVVTLQDEQTGKNSYKISDFKMMGSTDEYYNKSISNTKYYNANQNINYESFVFQVDFSNSNQNGQIENASLLIELQDQSKQTLIGVLGIQRDSCKYNVHPNKEAIIDVSTSVSQGTVYLGKSFDLSVTTNFKQNIINSKTIYDTKYFDQKMGIKISIFDNNSNQLNGDSLLGVKFILDGITYYPRVDGTIRINIAQRVSNVLSKIKVDTSQNTTLATGKYTVKVESFGSPDGIYYGINSSSFKTQDINIINGAYGLKVWFDDKTKIIDKKTGNTLYGNNTLLSHINYSSSLSNPIITVSLERRDYTNIYSLNYNKLDLKEFMTNSLDMFKENEYIVSTSPQANSTFFLNIKPQVKTGTYKLVYKLYDNNTYIGDAIEYFIVK